MISYNLYKKQDIHRYRFPLAGQTAGPNGLKFLVGTQGQPRGVTQAKKSFFSHGQRRALQIIIYIYIKTYKIIIDILRYYDNKDITRAAVEHSNFRAGSTFPVPDCTVSIFIDRTSRCKKVDAVRLYASYVQFTFTKEAEARNYKML